MFPIFVLLSLVQGVAFARPAVLDQIVARASSGDPEHIPVVISDLDETLVDSTTRRFFSYREAATTLCNPPLTPDCEKVAGLNLEEFLEEPNRYDQNPLFDRVGISGGEWRKQLDSRAIDIYLSGRRMELDQSVPGGTEFIRDLKRAGAKVFFVSSRFADVQREGTYRSLQALGLWQGDAPEEVILRPRGMSSIDFKKKSFASIKEWAAARHGDVILVMENEPENMNAMTKLFPGAYALFVEGAIGKQEPLLGPVLRMKNFR